MHSLCAWSAQNTPTKRCKGARKRRDILQVESPHRHTNLQYSQLFYSYSHFRVFSPIHTLHTAISNVWLRELLEYIWCAKLLPVWSIHRSTVNGVFQQRGAQILVEHLLLETRMLSAGESNRVDRVV